MFYSWLLPFHNIRGCHCYNDTKLAKLQWECFTFSFLQAITMLRSEVHVDLGRMLCFKKAKCHLSGSQYRPSTFTEGEWDVSNIFGRKKSICIRGCKTTNATISNSYPYLSFEHVQQHVRLSMNTYIKQRETCCYLPGNRLAVDGIPSEVRENTARSFLE